MTPDLRLAVEVLLGIIGFLSALYLRQAVGELRRISDTVASHDRSLAEGNERFRGLDREIARLREDLGKLADAVARVERDGCGRRKDCA